MHKKGDCIRQEIYPVCEKCISKEIKFKKKEHILKIINEIEDKELKSKIYKKIDEDLDNTIKNYIGLISNSIKYWTKNDDSYLKKDICEIELDILTSLDYIKRLRELKVQINSKTSTISS